MNPEKHNKLIVGIIAASLVLMVIGVISYNSYRNKSNIFEYNGFSVYDADKNGLKLYQIKFFKEGSNQPLIVNSRYHPKDLEEILVNIDLRKILIKKELYITMEPTLSGKATIAFSEINKYLENPYLFNLPTYPALLNNVVDNELPKITCGNVTEDISVIMFKIGEKNAIYNDNGCVILEAINEDELIKAADRLSLTMLGIMK